MVWKAGQEERNQPLQFHTCSVSGEETGRQGQAIKPLSFSLVTLCCTSSSELPSKKFQNMATSWGPNAQTHKPVGSISLSSNNDKLLGVEGERLEEKRFGLMASNLWQAGPVEESNLTCGGRKQREQGRVQR